MFDLYLMTALPFLGRLSELNEIGNATSARTRASRYVVDASSDYPHNTTTISPSTVGTTRNGEKEDGFPSTIIWNVALLSERIVASIDQQASVASTTPIRKDVHALANELFWLVQRASALHATVVDVSQSSYRPSATASARIEDHMNNNNDTDPTAFRKGFLLTNSELRESHADPWRGSVFINSESTAGAQQEPSGSKARTIRTPLTAASTTAAVESATERLRGSSSSLSSLSSSAIVPSKELWIWSCGAAEAVEGLQFSRPATLTAASALR
jgi:hypothetical protein